MENLLLPAAIILAVIFYKVGKRNVDVNDLLSYRYKELIALMAKEFSVVVDTEKNNRLLLIGGKSLYIRVNITLEETKEGTLLIVYTEKRAPYYSEKTTVVEYPQLDVQNNPIATFNQIKLDIHKKTFS